MREQITRCDFPGCGIKPALRVSVAVESYTDAAGSRDTRDCVFDLCDKHMHNAVNILLRLHAMEGNATKKIVRAIVGKEVGAA